VSPSTPSHWRWRAGEVEPGPAVIFDMDGVLANGDHRQHLLNKLGKKDWKTFFSKAGDDALIEEVARLTKLLDRDLSVVLLTARPTTIQDLTLAWLERFDIRWDLLVMRRDGDFSPSPEAKRHALEQLRDRGFGVLLAFDDDRRNVDMFHDEGVPCLYIHSGYYEA
jgi:beta-phosphoglucomutase-like phosphatase (HAD superfamily)